MNGAARERDRNPGTGIVSWLNDRLGRMLMRAWNAVNPPARRQADTDSPLFAQVQSRAQRRTDINDHLPTLFLEAHLARPNLIVELGVRGGESTFVFERVAQAHEADLVSVDLQPCGHISDYERWHFIQEDDVEFGWRFPDWCRTRNIDPSIDVLFVDTSHLFEHTVEEINVWFPHLSESGVALFHDTNLTRWYCRRDGRIGKGWDNDRGVVRALEQYLDVELDESRRFRTVARGFAVEHDPICNGLTILRRGKCISGSDCSTGSTDEGRR